MSLSEDLKQTYTGLIDGILRASDLEQVTAKQIRQGIQAGVSHDIEPYKKAIKDLIMERFDYFREVQTATPPAEPARNGSVKPVTNGLPKPTPAPPSAPMPSAIPAKRSSPSDVSVESVASPGKVAKHSEESDAAYAARLQAELNSVDRPTRGGGVRKTRTPVSNKKTPKKKSAAKVKSEDDSDASGSEVEDKPKQHKGAFHKPMALSEPLQRLTGETQLSRPQTVKRIWDYVKANDLQNPEDKRQIRCDDTLKAIFKQDSVHMFTMNKILSKNLYPVEE